MAVLSPAKPFSLWCFMLLRHSQPVGCSCVCRREGLGLDSLPDSCVKLSSTNPSLGKDKAEKKFKMH